MPDVCDTDYGWHRYTHINIHKIKVILEQAFKNGNNLKRISECLRYVISAEKKSAILRQGILDSFAIQRAIQ